MNQIGYTAKQISMLIVDFKINDYLQLTQAVSYRIKLFNNGVIPPDLSLITKYKSLKWVYNVLTGYNKFNEKLYNGLFYNKSFEFGLTAMRPPLVNSCVKYNFCMPLTVHQYSQDVCAFLNWIAEPWFNLKSILLLPSLNVLILWLYIILILYKIE